MGEEGRLEEGGRSWAGAARNLAHVLARRSLSLSQELPLPHTFTSCTVLRYGHLTLPCILPRRRFYALQ